MRLTRRDALVALGGLGFGSYGIGRVRNTSGDDVQTLLAVTDLIYPSQVTVDEEFLTTYVLGHTHIRPEYKAALDKSVSELNQESRRLFDQAFDSLSVARRRRVFRSLGIDMVRSDPDGMLSQRIRYYVVQDLLYALYSTPIGGRLLEKENPPGYPGGREAYQRGPGGQQ